jgi:hypothetical protein
MAGDLRGVYLIGNRSDKLVTAVLVQDLATGDTSTLPLEEYVHRGIEPPDGTLPWEQDITPKPAAPSVRPFQPDPSQWGTSTFDDAAARIATSHSQRNDAVLNSGGPQVFPPAPPTVSQVPPANSAATVDTPPAAVAGTAPREIRLETGKYALEGGAINAGAGNLTAYADVFRADRRVAVSVRDNAERAEMLARSLATTIREEIGRLKGRNEPEWRDQIDFLELVAATLDQIAAAIVEARQARTAEEREKRFSEAEGLATSLAKAAKDFAERNYERMIDYGGYCTMTILSTLLFTQMLGVSPDVAFVGAMGLLGIPGKKKD